MKFEFSRKIFKNTQILNFTKIRPLGAEVFQGTDIHDETNGPFFHIFANALKITCEIRCLRKDGKVFWFVTPCTVSEIYKLYGATYRRFLSIKNIFIK